MRKRHKLRLEGSHHLPAHGPAILLGNHSSFLDFPALLAVNPYEDLTLLALAALWWIPILRQMLNAYDAIPVTRSGRDTKSLGALFAALRQGRVVAISAEGGRSWDGRLGDVHPVLARLACSAGVPLVPVAIIGAQAALGRGALFPRNIQVTVRVGEPFQLPRKMSGPEAATQIQRAIAALLPAEQKPLAQDTRY
jgi:1-acyl-sn-glycerol-3-phosphate acyltransferase